MNPERQIRKVTIFYWWDVDRVEEEESEFHSTTEIAAFAFLDKQGNQVGSWKSTSSALDKRKEQITRKVPIGHEIIGLRCNTRSDSFKTWITDI